MKKSVLRVFCLLKRTCPLAIALVLLLGCTTKTKVAGNFNLLPVPQQFEITGISDFDCSNVHSYFNATKSWLPVFDNQLKHLTEANDINKSHVVLNLNLALDLNPEGYTLDITEDKITITGKDKAGLFYGLMSLSQLMEDACEQNANLPLTTITDFPELRYRAVHLDVKHHLEKTEYYYKLIDKLARYKVNGIITEMEDKLKFKRQPIIASADALSIAEWKGISEYATARNIDFSPLIQGLGHASFILKHPEYYALRDNVESDWAFNPLDPKTYEVQFDLYLDAIEATPNGKYLHVGGDEVHTTGKDSGISSLELQLIWLSKVSKFAEKHNRIPIFWDDMPLKQADVYDPMFRPEMSNKEVDSVWVENEHKLTAFLDRFPKNCIYMRWNYSSPEAIGNTKAMEWFSSNGLHVMGATAGQTRWVLMPQEEGNMEAIKTFAINSINTGTNGLLLTLWDDDSPHFELYMRGIIAFSEYTWSGNKRSKADIKSAYRQREFSNKLADSSYAFIGELEKPVAFWKNVLLKGNKRNYLSTMEDPLVEGVIDFPDPKNRGAWSKKHKDRLADTEKFIASSDSIAKKIVIMKSKAVRNTYTLDVYEQVNTMAGFAPKLLLALKAYDNSDTPKAKSEALKYLNKLQETFAVLREEFESVYAKTRILEKPENYKLDQDHHVHLANQSLNFDWQFKAEMLFFEKLEKELGEAVYLESAE
ncbi:glycoside hydrolase family 20 zincin-like fold domain-containing protein [Maribacter antarcticus]|uniref:glycoside hydrolase family 20 zincin-like fold domain-containing protein n=1 Tax=Maribacter antarcticus TaxID=505250 RepID=UPI00056B9C88|nr:glycoside hydrolase family 20 zincin-like fold domain-containing protein [Maribacter antarcticus]